MAIRLAATSFASGIALLRRTSTMHFSLTFAAKPLFCDGDGRKDMSAGAASGDQ